MKTFILISSIFYTILSTNSANAQQFKVGLEVGSGNYTMKKSHDFNNDIILGLPFRAKITSDFPSYWYYRPYVTFQIKKITFGFNLSYQSTGSRIASSDYSGVYKMEMKMEAISPALSVKATMLDYNGIEAKIGISSGTHYTKYRIDENLILQNKQQPLNNSLSKKGELYFIEPLFELSYGIKRITLSARSSYNLNLNTMEVGEIKSNNRLISPGVDWSGLRIGASLDYIIFDRTHKSRQ